MIGRGRQRTAGAVVVAVFLVAALALFAYLFAGGSPDALPLLLGVTGSVAGCLSVFFSARFFGRGNSLVGRLARGAALAAACVAGSAVNAAIPFDGTAPELLAKGLGFGAAMASFLSLVFGLLLPPSPSAEEDRG